MRKVIKQGLLPTPFVCGCLGHRGLAAGKLSREKSLQGAELCKTHLRKSISHPAYVLLRGNVKKKGNQKTKNKNKNKKQTKKPAVKMDLAFISWKAFYEESSSYILKFLGIILRQLH